MEIILRSKWNSKYINVFDDITENFKKGEILSEINEGNVYKYKNYVIKARSFTHICKECAIREFEVGILANHSKNKHLIETVGYFENYKYAYIVTKYVP